MSKVECHRLNLLPIWTIPSLASKRVRTSRSVGSRPSWYRGLYRSNFTRQALLDGGHWCRRKAAPPPPPHLCRVTGTLFLIGALSFAAAATLLSATFDWPDILREPADVVLPRFAEGGASLVWTWFATAWTYAILIVPILLLPTALRRRDDAALWVASFAGAISVVLALIGFLRWVFVVPPLARLYPRGRCRKPIRAGRSMVGPAPIRWGATRGASWTVARDRLVGDPQHHRATQSGVAALAWSAGPDRQRALPVQSGRHPGNGSPRLSGVRSCRPHRKHRLGTLGRCPRRHTPASPEDEGADPAQALSIFHVGSSVKELRNRGAAGSHWPTTSEIVVPNGTTLPILGSWKPTTLGSRPGTA